MLINVIKVAGDSSKPNMVEMNTAFNIGDKIKMEYDWCRRVQCMNGYMPHWYKAVAEFEVVNIVCNMLINPPEVWVRKQGIVLMQARLEKRAHHLLPKTKR